MDWERDWLKSVGESKGSRKRGIVQAQIYHKTVAQVQAPVTTAKAVPHAISIKKSSKIDFFLKVFKILVVVY